MGGRVNIDYHGQPVYKNARGSPDWYKLTPNLPLWETLFKTGVTGSPLIQQGGILMMVTGISYFIIQARTSTMKQCVLIERRL